jgi:SPOR domain
MTASIWNIQIGFVGSGEEAGRAQSIVEAMRRRGKPVHGEGPWWNVIYEDLETREAALAALGRDLDGVDPQWRDVLSIS